MGSFGGLEKNIKAQINLEDYDGKVVVENGKYKTIDGVNLSERGGMLYVAEGESDAGTMLLKKNDKIISSGF